MPVQREKEVGKRRKKQNEEVEEVKLIIKEGRIHRKHSNERPKGGTKC